MPGLVSVVKESPLQGKWFADLFEWALGTSAVSPGTASESGEMK